MYQVMPTKLNSKVTIRYSLDDYEYNTLLFMT